MDAEWTRVGAYVLCRDEPGRLLLTRFTWPGHPESGRWTLPGGGMEWGESARDTAKRELAEETGLTATLTTVAGVHSQWYSAQESVRGTSGHVIAIVFHSTDVAGRLRDDFEGLDTTDGAAWHDLDEVRRLPLVRLVDAALDWLTPTG